MKLSDALVLDARIAGEVEERSIAGQVEFWAKLGRSLDLLLEGRQVLALRRNAGTQPLSEALASVNTSSGRKRLADTLASQPYPHFKSHPGKPGLLIRTDEDGKQAVGRFVNRVFSVVEVADGQPSQAVNVAKLRTKNSLRAKKASPRTQARPRRKAQERQA